MEAKRIEELQLSVRCRKALLRAGITTVEMLEELLVKDRLKWIPGVGYGCLNEVRLELERSKHRHILHLPHVKLPHIKVAW